jgi:hypothetical protein
MARCPPPLTPPSRADRRRAVLLGAGVAALGLVCAAIAVTGLSETVAGLTGSTPLVFVRKGAAAAVPAAVALLACAAMLLLPQSTDGKREVRLFAVALCCLPLLVALPLVLGWTAGMRLTNAGYEQCAGPMGSRGALNQSWARPPAVCPADQG